MYNEATDKEEMERGLNLNGCPEELQGKVKQVMKEYWDVFCERGLRNPIRDFSFQIDMGNSKP
eukprot:9842079-Ditylum_brightwellii.AAC.1